jgi:acyl-[acyl-carrier-protein]-phospholipid O-acyltransferase/long-chain-fatty-acid--[acyl-carrier-protein] ligase
VLLTTDAKCKREDFQKFARQKGATELIVPAEILVVSKIPLLGTGKPDYVASLALAKDMAAAKQAASGSAEQHPLTPAV